MTTFPTELTRTARQTTGPLLRIQLKYKCVRAGVNGSDRVTLIWANGTIQSRWLQVSLLATNQTGLAGPDVFYVGNAPGESGDSTSDTYVNAVDEIGARHNPHGRFTPAAIDDAYDYDRDRYVNAADELIGAIILPVVSLP